MDGSTTVELVLLHGGRADDDSAEAPEPCGDLRVVRGNPGDLQVALEETVAAARKVRREIEERIAAALDELLRARAPAPEPR
jgi:hypothetical protein